MKHILIILLAALSLHAAQVEKYWIYFTDKNIQNADASLHKAQANLSARALARRAKLHQTSLVDESDIPISAAYIEKMAQLQIEPLRQSKWLNAISVRATKNQVEQLKKLPFVRSVKPVATLKRKILPEENLFKPTLSNNTYALDYGASITQNEMINVPNVHALNLDGSGVLIGIFDAGFRVDHEALHHLDIVATYDFVQGDENVDNEEGDVASQHDHGTSVLSACGGYAPGTLIGPAYGASYVLAKTEDIAGETQIEEDNWVAAAEWSEQLGVDIISTSVGYIDWYTPEDMDGETAPMTIAADMAVSKGIVVISSAGNEADDPWQTVTPPADGKKVIAVGAVMPSGMITKFSSLGPTADGRIKPDVMALGSSVVLARPSGYNLTGSGTSYSAPQIAGVAALILQAHPQLVPNQVNMALRLTANNIDNPNNQYGWGVVDALAAVNYFGSIVDLPDENAVVQVFPNPLLHTNLLTFQIDLTDNVPVELTIYNLLGQEIYRKSKQMGPGKQISLFWDGTNKQQHRANSGIYVYKIRLGEKTVHGKFTVLN